MWSSRRRCRGRARSTSGWRARRGTVQLTPVGRRRVGVPICVVPATKNVTDDTVPSLSVALAEIVIVLPATTDAPFTGAVMLTGGRHVRARRLTDARDAVVALAVALTRHVRTVRAVGGARAAAFDVGLRAVLERVGAARRSR
jgi:hypothetical protein